MSDTQSLAGRYRQLEMIRSPFLERSREAARLTIPTMLPPTDSSSEGQATYTPFQSVGSQGVNNLASKLLLALLPPGSPFFRYTLDDAIIDEAESESEADERGKFEEALAKAERATMKRIEQKGFRPQMYDALRHLVVAGNSLLHIPEGTKRPRLFRLDEYVIKRDSEGLPLEIVVQQTLSPTAMSPDLKALWDTHSKDEQPQDEKSGQRNIPLFTQIRRVGNLYTVKQELGDQGLEVESARGTYTLENMPWIALAINRMDREDYGRGRVDEFIGDLISLEGLMQSLVEGSAAAARLLFLVRPGSTTRPKTLTKAPNGAFVEGDARDITVLKVDKHMDFSVVEKMIGRLEKRLATIFMMTSELPRDAERVTAEEIRLIASELEDTLGGIYSLLSEELQLPLVRLITRHLTKEGILPKLPKDSMTPQIVTGLEALGRTQDLRKLDTLVAGMQGLIDPETFRLYVKIGDFIQRRSTALNIDVDGLIRTEEEVQEILQKQQEAALAQTATPELIKQGATSPQGE